MTKHYKVLAACFLMFMLASCGPSTEEAIKYNDSIIDEQALIVEKINNLYKCIDDLDHPENMDEAYKQALMQVESGTKKVSKLPDFAGQSELREAALKLFSVYKSVIQTEIKTMVDILKMQPVDITPEIEAQFDTMNTQALNKMDNSLKEFQDVQVKFSLKYNFVLHKSTETN